MTDFEKKAKDILLFFADKNHSLSFDIRKGEGNIIVSAPHSVTQTRAGKTKAAEVQTGVLAELLHEQTGCHAIYKLRNDNDDANNDADSPYRSALADYIASLGIRSLLDLHMLAPFRNEMIDIGTGKGVNLCGRDDLLECVCGIFEEYDFGSVEIDKPFSASGQNTVSSSIARMCDIPCFQIEINARLLMSNSKGYRLYDVFDCLERIVAKLEVLA